MNSVMNSNENKTSNNSSGGSLRKWRKTQEGVVSSCKMDKTVVVKITQQVMDSRYHKYIKRTTKYLAHDEQKRCQEGDIVKIVECRPLSKRKRWRIVEVVEKAI
jgi:small subunit ribosomal protein S17